MRSCSSFQNIKLAGARQKGLKKAILCGQAFHARRSLMYYQEQFPEAEFLACPVVTRGISRDNCYQTKEGIDTVLGELERCAGRFYEIMYENFTNLGRQEEIHGNSAAGVFQKDR